MDDEAVNEIHRRAKALEALADIANLILKLPDGINIARDHIWMGKPGEAQTTLEPTAHALRAIADQIDRVTAELSKGK